MKVGTVARALIALVGVVGMGSLAHANLLTNGDFNIGTHAAGPTSWTRWSWNEQIGGFADYKNPADGFAKDGSPYINAGNWGDPGAGGGGWYQIVPATAGESYTLSVDCGTEGWAAASGEMRLIFLDSSSGIIRQDVLHTADAVAGQAWTSFSKTWIAPAGTTQVKAEFATWGVPGTVIWDNASLNVPEPAAGIVACAALLLGSRRRKTVA
jgi:hypothetical protein